MSTDRRCAPRRSEGRPRTRRDHRRLPATALALLLGVAGAGPAGCRPDPPDDDDTGDDDSAAGDDDAGDDDVGDDDSGPQAPPSPLPFTVTLSGGTNETVVIDTFGSCQNYSGSADFRQQWTGGSWVLRVAVVGSYAGVGAYDETQGASVTLLRNVANGEFFQASAAQGHTVSAVFAGDDGVQAWGEVTLSGMTDTAAAGGQVTVEPATLPIWCSSVQH